MRFRSVAPQLRHLLISAFCVGLVITGIPSARGEERSGESQKDAATYSVSDTDEGKAILRNGEKIAEYLTRSGSKPVVWPVIGPDGVAMTRAYPMAPAGPAERDDHVHHRSLWFTHGEVNGTDFWAETEGSGTIAHRDFTAVSEGDVARIATTNDWLDNDGKRILSDERVLEFSDVGDHRVIDVDITLTATDGPVTFGDTKEGSFGIRVAGTMKVDAEPGGKIVTSRGDTDGKAWGKQAEWVDYVGPIDGETYGITIMNHPSSFGFPTRWHVRTYGLFAANPFGEHHFVGGEPTDGVKLDAGDSMRLRYRVLLHRGSTEEANIAEAWQRYSGSEATPYSDRAK